MKKVTTSAGLKLSLLTTTIFIFFCTPVPPTYKIKKNVVIDNNESQILSKTRNRDTTQIIIEAVNKKDKRFIENSLTKLLSSFKVDTVTADSNARLYTFRIYSAPQKNKEQMLLKPIENQSFEITNTLMPAKDIDTMDTSIVHGGNVIIHSFRTNPIPLFAPMWSSDLNLKPDTTEAYQLGNTSVKIVEPSIVEITIDKKHTNKNSFDFITEWGLFINHFPATANALFVNVVGIDDFIDGKEALVRGFTSKNKYKINILFDKAVDNTHPFFSLSSIYLSEMYNGIYKKISNKVVARTDNSKAYLDQCVLALKRETKPFVALSLGKYDGIELAFKKDIDFALKEMATTHNLYELQSDNYSLHITLKDHKLRSYLNSMISAKRIGEVTACNFTLSKNIQPSKKIIPIKQEKPLRFLCNKNDPIAIRICNSIRTEFEMHGIAVTLVKKNQYSFESALYAKHYDIVLGIYSDHEATFSNAKQFYSYKWFSDNSTLSQRLNEYRQIPLFSIKRYLLIKKEISLINANIATMHFDLNK